MHSIYLLKLIMNILHKPVSPPATAGTALPRQVMFSMALAANCVPMPTACQYVDLGITSDTTPPLLRAQVRCRVPIGGQRDQRIVWGSRSFTAFTNKI